VVPLQLEGGDFGSLSKRKGGFDEVEVGGGRLPQHPPPLAKTLVGGSEALISVSDKLSFPG